MDEFDFIKKIQPKNYKQPSLIRGIGDDAAVFRQSSQDIVTSVDTFVENIHFSEQTMEPFHVGYRALAANISDMAAMGCDPTYYMVSIVIPNHWDEDRLMGIYQGMDHIAKQYEVELIGGDTVSGNQLVLSITIIGFVEKGKAIYRGNAVEGDIVFTTGTLGDSAAGLHVLTSLAPNQQENYSYVVGRHRMPSPRVAFARELSQLTRVALNDISDGIANEAGEIAEASKVSLQLQYDRLPDHPSLRDFSEEQQKNWKLFGGEDFELIGTVPAKDWPVVEQVAERTGTNVTKIGQVVESNKQVGVVYLQDKETRSVLNKSGYTHMK